jgi:hypothetical protein
MKDMLSQGNGPAGPSSGNNKQLASKVKHYEAMLATSEREKIKLKSEVSGLKVENSAL